MSFYKNATFFVKGIREFTKSGYESASISFRSSDLKVDLSSRSVMISGASSSIGRAVALALADRGATLHLVCKSKEKGEVLLREIVDSTENENIHLHVLDLSSPNCVYTFATEFAETNNELHVLINNAGCLFNTREIDEHGLEKNFATNTLSTHILTTTLLPLLSRHAGSRVITVSSGAMLTQRLLTHDLQSAMISPFDGSVVHAQNKRQQVVLMKQLATRYPAVFFASMHPGWVDSSAIRTSMHDFYEKLQSRFRTPEQGADTVVWLSTSEAAMNHDSGLFFCDRQVVAQHLALAGTESSPQDELQLITLLDACSQRFRRPVAM